MDQWDRGVRRLGDVWGRRQLTETGLRATLVGWKALLVDQSAAVRGVVAPLLSPLPLVVLGVFLNRRRAVGALALLATFVVTPRLERAPVARGLFAAAIVVGVVGLLWLLRHRSPTGGGTVDGMVRGHGAPWAVVALATAAYAVVVAIWPTVWSGARAPLATTPLLSPPYLAPSIAAAVAAGLLWCWAWWLPRATMAVFTAGMTFLWVWLSAPELCTSASGARTTCGLTGAPSFFGSLWWGVVIVLYVSTWVAGLYDFGRERHRTLRAPSSTQ
jgi:hypothetical protein